MNVFNLTAKEKLIRCRVQLTNSHPFFGRLVMSLKFIEKKEIGTMGVNKFGVLYYNPDFVDKLSQDELKGVLCHEILHCAFEHFDEKHKPHHQIANVVEDLVNNDLIRKNGLQLPSQALMPSSNHEFELKLPKGGTHTVSDIDKRTSYSLYDEVYKVWEDNKKDGDGNGGDGDGWQKGHDEHLRDDKKGEGKNGKNNKGVSHRDSEYWKNKIVESYMASKQAGKSPAGIDRIVDKITNPKMTWRQMLQKFIRDRIPYDFTWRRPNKRTYSSGWYFPKTKKEGVTVTLLIDTSGSVSEKELGQIFGEMKGIVGQIRGLNLRVIYHDTKVYEGMTKINPSLIDVKNEFTKAKGGGGTDFETAYKWVEDNVRDTDIIIHATDGYDRFPKNFKLPLIVLLCGSNKSVKDVKDECRYARYVVKVEDSER